MNDVRIVAENPWGSLVAWVDDDGRTVYLHLGAKVGEPLRSVWVRNVVEAPATLDPAKLAAGERLPQPRAATRQPLGDPLQRGVVLELLWFEEGDGVALFVDGQLEAVLPPWSNEAVPGYAAGARGRGPFAWELVAPNPLATRVSRARAHWDALNRGGLQQLIDRADVEHQAARLGQHLGAWSVAPPSEPARRVAVYLARTGRAPHLYATVGMAAQGMPQVEADLDDFVAHRRVNLVIAALGDTTWCVRWLGDMARYPWRAVTWIGDGHVVEVPLLDPVQAPGKFPAALLAATPPPDGTEHAPDLSGQKFRNGEPITYLWTIPITAAETALFHADGVEALVARLDGAGVGWVHDPERACTVDPAHCPPGKRLPLPPSHVPTIAPDGTVRMRLPDEPELPDAKGAPHGDDEPA